MLDGRYGKITDHRISLGYKQITTQDTASLDRAFDLLFEETLKLNAEEKKHGIN